MAKINIEDYEKYGLGDIYYGLISFISGYVTSNFNPMEVLYIPDGQQSTYAFASDNMMESLKEFLDYLKQEKEIYLPNLKRKISIDRINLEEQLTLEQIGKEYMIEQLKRSLNERELSKESKNVL